MLDAREISRSLDEIASLLSLSEKNHFKVRAFERGARVTAALEADLADLIADDRLRAVEGIGPSLAKQIIELWNTGTSRLLTRLRAEYPRGAAELAQLSGLTARRIRALHEGLGVSSIDDLREACEQHRVRSLHGFGAKTEQRLLQAIELRREQALEEPQLLLVDALKIAARIEQALVGGREAVSVQTAGAVRRFEETVKELELVVVCDDESQVFERLARMPALLTVDRERKTAQLARGIPLLLHFATVDRVAPSLIVATGDVAHVDALRTRAAARGLSLRRGGLFDASGTPCTTQDEAAIYRALELDPVPPEQRVGLDPTAHADWSDLLTQADIRGVVHCHTNYSDGKNTIEEMARAAEASGMHYITITDHSPSAHYARGVTLDRLQQQWDEIATVQERVKIRILRGAESDILADGSLDYPDHALERFDVLIGSIHSRFKQDRRQMTDRLVRAMQLPVFKIWGHALGRLLLSRPPLDCDLEAVLDALAGSRGAIEINADPHRLDLPPAFIPLARERRIPFVVSVDAHSIQGMNVLPLGIGMARRGGLRRHEVLNTLNAADFASKVRPVQ